MSDKRFANGFLVMVSCICDDLPYRLCADLETAKAVTDEIGSWDDAKWNRFLSELDGSGLTTSEPGGVRILEMQDGELVRVIEKKKRRVTP